MEFEVLEPGHVLVPNYHFINQEGVCVFVASEHAAVETQAAAGGPLREHRLDSRETSFRKAR